MDALARKVLVIGLGNPDRGDDAVGGIVAEHLSRRLPSDVTIIAPRGDVLSLIGDWVAFDALVCIDAAAPMGMPGRIHRIALPKDELPSNFPVTSSHAFGLTAAIGLARALRLAPDEIIIYAVEGMSFEAGARLTPEVVAATSLVADQVVAEVARLGHDASEAAFHA